MYALGSSSFHVLHVNQTNPSRMILAPGSSSFHEFPWFNFQKFNFCIQLPIRCKTLDMASLTEAEEALCSTRAKANFKRLTRLLMRGGVKLLRETLDSIHSPADLPKKLSDPATENDLKKAKTSKKEWDCLYPSPGVYGQSTDFDITLIFRLLRTICGLTPPPGPRGWDELPKSSDHSLVADLVRIKYYRNEVHGHKKTLEISDPEFVDLWGKISEALIRIAANISPEKRDEWKKAIDDFLTKPLTPEEERCVEELDRWYKQDMDVKNEVEQLNENVKTLQNGMTQMMGGQESILEELQGLQELVKQSQGPAGSLKSSCYKFTVKRSSFLNNNLKVIDSGCTYFSNISMQCNLIMTLLFCFRKLLFKR